MLRRNDSASTPVEIGVDYTPMAGTSGRRAGVVLKRNGEPVKTARFRLSPMSQEELSLEVSAPTTGTYLGELGLIVGDSRTPVAVEIERKALDPEKIGFVGVEGGKLTIKTDKHRFDWPLVLKRQDEFPVPVQVAVEITDLLGPDGMTVRPRLFRENKPLTEPVELSPRQWLSLTLKDIPSAEGSYKGEILVRAGDLASITKIELVRTRPDLDLAVQDIFQVRALTEQETKTIQLRLRNDSGLGRTIYPPQILQLNRVEVTGEETLKLGMSGYRVGYERADRSPIGDLIEVPANGALDLGIAITGLWEPGRYEGKLLVAAPGRKSVEKDFNLALRLPIWWAAVVIAIGVILSAVVRHYQTNARPRLLVQRRISQLTAGLSDLLQTEGADLIARERRVIASLRAALDGVADDLVEVSNLNTATAAVQNIGSRCQLLPDWIAYRRQFAEIRPQSICQEMDGELETIGHILAKDQASDEEIGKAKASLSQLDESLQKRLLKHLEEAAGVMREEIASLPEAEQQDFSQAKTELDRVTTAVKDSDLSEARKTLDEARVYFADAATELLRSRLDAQTVPFGFDQPVWERFVGQLVTDLDRIAAEGSGERRIELLRTANTAYLRGIIERLAAKVGGLTKAKIAGAENALALASTKLTEAANNLQAHQLVAARQAYETAVKQISSVKDEILKAGIRLGQAGQADAPAQQAMADVPENIVDTAITRLLAFPLGRGVSVAAVRTALFRYDTVFAVVMLAVAVLTGLKLLYIDDPDYGWWDLALAFLWGAGLHAVADQTFQGLKGMVQKFK